MPSITALRVTRVFQGWFFPSWQLQLKNGNLETFRHPLQLTHELFIARLFVSLLPLAVECSWVSLSRDFLVTYTVNSVLGNMLVGASRKTRHVLFADVNSHGEAKSVYPCEERQVHFDPEELKIFHVQTGNSSPAFINGTVRKSVIICVHK